MVTNHQDAHAVIDEAKQEMVREPIKIYPSKIAFLKTICFRCLGSFSEEGEQLGEEFVGELLSCDLLVIVHNSRNVGNNLPMKFQAHQPRRRRIWDSRFSTEMA